MFWHLYWSPLAVNSTDWTWFGKAHNWLYKISNLKMHIRAKSKPWGWRTCLQTEVSPQWRTWYIYRVNYVSTEGTDPRFHSLHVEVSLGKKPQIALNWTKKMIGVCLYYASNVSKDFAGFVSNPWNLLIVLYPIWLITLLVLAENQCQFMIKL